MVPGVFCWGNVYCNVEEIGRGNIEALVADGFTLICELLGYHR